MSTQQTSYEKVENTIHHNPQTEIAFQSDIDGQIVAVERGVTHGSRYTVTRFAAPFWESMEPWEYHGSFDDFGSAVDRAKDVLESKA